MKRTVLVEINWVGNDCPKCDDHHCIYGKFARFCRSCATRLTKRVCMDVEICLENSDGLDDFLGKLRIEIRDLISKRLETYMP